MKCWGGGGITCDGLASHYRYVCQQKEWVLSPFGLKLGIHVDFNHFGLKSGKVLHNVWNRGLNLGKFFRGCIVFLLFLLLDIWFRSDKSYEPSGS